MATPDTFDIGGELTVNRLGFGAMRLCGEGIIGAPDDEGSLFGRLNAGGTRLWAHTDLGTVALRAIER